MLLQSFDGFVTYRLFFLLPFRTLSFPPFPPEIQRWRPKGDSHFSSLPPPDFLAACATLARAPGFTKRTVMAFSSDWHDGENTKSGFLKKSFSASPCSWVWGREVLLELLPAIGGRKDPITDQNNLKQNQVRSLKLNEWMFFCNWTDHQENQLQPAWAQIWFRFGKIQAICACALQPGQFLAKFGWNPAGRFIHSFIGVNLCITEAAGPNTLNSFQEMKLETLIGKRNQALGSKQVPDKTCPSPVGLLFKIHLTFSSKLHPAQIPQCRALVTPSSTDLALATFCRAHAVGRVWPHLTMQRWHRASASEISSTDARLAFAHVLRPHRYNTPNQLPTGDSGEHFGSVSQHMWLGLRAWGGASEGSRWPMTLYGNGRWNDTFILSNSCFKMDTWSKK